MCLVESLDPGWDGTHNRAVRDMEEAAMTEGMNEPPRHS